MTAFRLIPLAVSSAACIAAGQGPTSLSDAMTRALAANPSVNLARHKVAESEARLKESRAIATPSIVLNGSASSSNGALPDSAATTGFHTEQASLDLAIPNVARVRATQSQTKSQLDAARAGLARAELEVLFRSAEAYFNLMRARDGLDIARANLDQAERQLADAHKRLDAGDIPASDILKIQVIVAQSKATLARAEARDRSSLQALNSLLGRDLGAELQLGTWQAPAQAPTRDEAVSKALANSPDILEADANLSAALAGASIARRANDPSFGLQGSYNRTTDPTNFAHVAALLISISLPLYDGGVIRQQVRQADAQALQAKASLDLARQSVRLEVEQAYLEVVSDEANLSASSEILRAATVSAEKARLSYEAGLTTTRDVLDAQLSLAQAKSDANNAQFDFAIALVKLKQTMGVLAP